MEEVLQSVMYEVPSRRDVAQVLITAESVREHAFPTLVPRDSVHRTQPPGRNTPHEKSA